MQVYDVNELTFFTTYTIKLLDEDIPMICRIEDIRNGEGYERIPFFLDEENNINYTKDKFSYKVAFIFLANNIYGPDIVYLFFITPFHSILGFALLAIPLSLVYSYSSRFSIKKSEGLFPLKFIDEGIREVDWKN